MYVDRTIQLLQVQPPLFHVWYTAIYDAKGLNTLEIRIIISQYIYELSIEKIFRDNDNSLYIFSFPILSIKKFWISFVLVTAMGIKFDSENQRLTRGHYSFKKSSLYLNDYYHHFHSCKPTEFLDTCGQGHLKRYNSWYVLFLCRTWLFLERITHK